MFNVNLKGMLAAATVATIAAFGATTAQAATCSDNGSTVKTFTMAAATSCYAWGTGNLNGSSADAVLNGGTQGNSVLTAFGAGGTPPISNLLLLDKSDGGGLLSGILSGTLTGGTVVGTTLTGSVSVGAVAAGYNNLILALKIGNSSIPSWAAFVISAAGAYDFVIDPKQGSGISHVMLYGTACTPGTPGCGPAVNVVPVPASLPLLLTVLVGGGAFMRRRARKAT